MEEQKFNLSNTGATMDAIINHIKGWYSFISRANGVFSFNGGITAQGDVKGAENGKTHSLAAKADVTALQQTNSDVQKLAGRCTDLANADAELLLRQQGRSSNYAAHLDFVKWLQYTTSESGTHERARLACNAALDQMHSQNESDNTPIGFVNVCLDGAHMAIWSSIISWSAEEWVQVAIGASVDTDGLIAPAAQGDILRRNYSKAKGWSAWKQIAAGDGNTLNLKQEGDMPANINFNDGEAVIYAEDGTEYHTAEKVQFNGKMNTDRLQFRSLYAFSGVDDVEGGFMDYSTGAAGQVLTADGRGNAYWGNNDNVLKVLAHVTWTNAQSMRVVVDAGELQDGDTFALFRYIKRRNGANHHGTTGADGKGIHGWLQAQDAARWGTRNGAITLTRHTGGEVRFNNLAPTAYQASRITSDENAMISLVGRVCAIAIMRNGKRISNYMPFTMIKDKLYGYRLSRLHAGFIKA